ncbi:MAG TPA: hypothetical protein VJC16_05790 [Candidatus Nanoarchaeia archaeon]|nr:hypothetical protein [Candidatus Nanoarchaeia archaeon]
MQKVAKCTECGALRILRDELCKRCAMNGFHEVEHGPSEAIASPA